MHEEDGNKMKLHNGDIKETNHLIAYIERLDSVVWSISVRYYLKLLHAFPKWFLIRQYVKLVYSYTAYSDSQTRCKFEIE